MDGTAGQKKLWRYCCVCRTRRPQLGGRYLSGRYLGGATSQTFCCADCWSAHDPLLLRGLLEQALPFVDEDLEVKIRRVLNVPKAIA